MLERARPSPEAPTLFGPERRIDTRPRAVHRVETAQHSLKRTPRFNLAPREAQNDARPEYRAILQGECALGAVEGRFGLPGRFMCIGSRTPAQGAHTSATKALGVRNGQLSSRWSLLTTPSPKPYGTCHKPTIGRCASRGPWASPGVPLEWLGRLQFVPGGLEGENRILEAATESPTAVFDACGARALPGRTADVVQDPCTRSRPLFRRRTRHWVGSRIVRRSWSTPFSRAPGRSVRQSAWSAPARSRAHGGHVRSSPTQRACDGDPGSRGAPGGRVGV